jgi:uncharacterized protein (DUF2062 family)
VDESGFPYWFIMSQLRRYWGFFFYACWMCHLIATAKGSAYGDCVWRCCIYCVQDWEARTAARALITLT